MSFTHQKIPKTRICSGRAGYILTYKLIIVHGVFMFVSWTA